MEQNNLQNQLQLLGEQLNAVVQTALTVEDIRPTRSASLEIQASNGNIYNKGIVWTGMDHTRQLVIHGSPDRLFSSETIDLFQDKEYRIANETVLSSDSLGLGVVNSNLRSVGTLRELNVGGNVNIAEFIRFHADSERLNIGGGEPNGQLSITSWDHEFVIDPKEDRTFKLGTWTTTGISIITDDTERLSIGASGDVVVSSRAKFNGTVGIGVNNFGQDVDLAVGGAVRIQDKKFEVGNSTPSQGSYKKGDIVWSTNPVPTGYVGWICVREGTPGEWKPFGQISV
jgi:hypothetical protein